MLLKIVNYILCSGLLLMAYHGILKSKGIYVFNRCYLLFSILFPLVVPFIFITKPFVSEPLAVIQSPVKNQIIAEYILNTDFASKQPAIMAPISSVNYYLWSILAIYIIITALLLLRFFKNLYTIWLKVRQNENVSHQRASLILINDCMVPHTFLNFIFLNKQEYHNDEIAPAILQHELAHVRHRHSIDVILLEVIQAFCWFNPFLWFYRKAIQLNHELMADAAVLIKKYDVVTYQKLLVEKMSYSPSLSITSQFNYSITKTRLIMMTKETSVRGAWIARVSVLSVIAIATALFCNNTQAVPKLPIANIPPKIKRPGNDTVQSYLVSKTWSNKYPSTQQGVTKEILDEYSAIVAKYAGSKRNGIQYYRKFDLVDRNRLEQIFKQMSRPQQMQQEIGFSVEAKMPKVVPTQVQLDSWANANLYGVWIDGKRIKNDDLSSYKPEKFGHVFVSRLTPAAINYQHYKYQVDLMTVDTYEKGKTDPLEMVHRIK